MRIAESPPGARGRRGRRMEPDGLRRGVDSPAGSRPVTRTWGRAAYGAARRAQRRERGARPAPSLAPPSGLHSHARAPAPAARICASAGPVWRRRRNGTLVLVTLPPLHFSCHVADTTLFLPLHTFIGMGAWCLSRRLRRCRLLAAAVTRRVVRIAPNRAAAPRDSRFRQNERHCYSAIWRLGNS